LDASVGVCRIHVRLHLDSSDACVVIRKKDDVLVCYGAGIRIWIGSRVESPRHGRCLSLQDSTVIRIKSRVASPRHATRLVSKLFLLEIHDSHHVASGIAVK
jgi:hypothetical protein